MYSVLLLIVSFGALSGLYILLNAPFVAAIQIIVYAGAIMVLFLFVVMLLNAPPETPAGDGVPVDALGVPGRADSARCSSVAARRRAGLGAPAHSRSQRCRPTTIPAPTSVHAIGVRLFREYAFAFEATSVLILVAMVGAVVLARKEH